MKKNGIYLLLVLVLGAVAFYFYWQKKEESKTPADQAFAVENAEKLTKIFLADKNGRQVTLTRTDDGWLVNDKYAVMPVKIDLLLRSLEKVQVQMGIPQPAWDNVIKDLAVRATKVELYKNGQDKPYKVYYIGSIAPNYNANYALMFEDGKPAERPYMVSLPGFIGDLQVRYILDEKEWRDTKVFRYAPNDIKSIKLSYNFHPTNSFDLQVLGRDSFAILPLGNEAPVTDKPLYKPGINSYLTFFQNLNVEAFENTYVYKDSILSEEPLATLTVTDTDNQTSAITLYRMRLNYRSKLQFDQHGQELEYDLDRYYATFNNGQDFGIVQQFVFGKVLRRRIDFYKQ